MNGLQVALIVLGALVLAGQILNIIADIGWAGWVMAFSWIATGINLGISITLIIAVARGMSPMSFKVSLIFYYISDVFTLFVFIMFITSGLFNWAKLVNFLLITPLIVVLHIYMCQMPVGGISYDPNVQTPQYQYQQMTYQPATPPSLI